MKISIQDKVYTVKFGYTNFVAKDSQKVLKNVDNLNVDSLTVIAKDAYDALEKIAPYLLKREKVGLKDHEQWWVESVELDAIIDDITIE